MFDQEHFDALWKGSVDNKEHQWYSHGDRDVAPAVGVLLHGSTEVNLMPPVPDGMRLHDAIKAVFDSMEPHVLENLALIVTCVDAHVRKQGSDLPPPNYRYGDLAEDFATNPLSNVTEALVMVIASDDRCGGCDVRQYMAEYTISDGGVLRWGERIETDDPLGPSIDVLKARFKKEKL